jgi:hypothetical protein
MTDDEGLRLVCRAALRENSSARDFLHARLEACLAETEGERQLLLALAWLDPDSALSYCNAENHRYLLNQEGVYDSINELCAAHRFYALSAEEKAAHRVMTGLLPADAPEVKERRHLYHLAALIAREAAGGMGSTIP